MFVVDLSGEDVFISINGSSKAKVIEIEPLRDQVISYQGDEWPYSIVRIVCCAPPEYEVSQRNIGITHDVSVFFSENEFRMKQKLVEFRIVDDDIFEFGWESAGPIEVVKMGGES